MSVPPVNAPASIASISNLGVPSAPQAKESGNVFAKLIGQANQDQLVSDQAIRQLASGRSEGVQDVVMSVAKADLSFRLILEMRNRLIDAYQEVMRMQV